MPTVLVTGITGFLASHIVDLLLNDNYKVIGTARSSTKADLLVTEFKQKYPNSQLHYEIVKDIVVDDAFDEILKKYKDEINYIMHTASPYVFGLNKPLKDAYLDPALKGTLNVLKSAKLYAPNVTNVVITSSFAAIGTFPHRSNSQIYTNKDWNPINWEDVKNEVDAYYASKTYAEKAAWKFMNEENPVYKLTTVCPPYIFGPQVFESLVTKTLNVSNEVALKLFKLDPETKEITQGISGFGIDVRDVARFHILAIQKENLYGQRAFISESKFYDKRFLDILKKHFPERKYVSCNLKEVELPTCDVSNVVEFVGGYTFITHEQSVVDTVNQYKKVHVKV